MSARMSRTAVGVLAGALWAGSLSLAAGPEKLSGSIVGLVSDTGGIPQMGATVMLYNRFDRLLKKALTTETGAFGFDSLIPDVYTVRVSLASFLPALKRNVIVQPGMQSLLNVNLASVFSSIELVAMVPGNSALMSDDWKWVLRSSIATRPVLRLIPEIAAPKVQRASGSAVFSETRGLVKLSAGDQGMGSAISNEPDLGTAFALATSFLGKNQLQVSGNIGYSAVSGMPTAAFRTSYRRELPGGSAPEVRITMRQLFLPSRVGAAALGGMQETGSTPVLRTLSASMLDHEQLTDRLRFEYGFSLDSVTFLDRLNYFSPFGRLIYDLGDGEAVQFSYASGTPPADLLASDGETGVELQQDLATLGAFPRVSLRSGKARVQRAQSWEVGYRRKVGTRTFSAAAYTEDVSNAAVMVTGADGLESTPDLLPDVFSNSWVFNAGHYHSLGYLVSVTQSLGDRLDLSVAYGSGGALTADSGAAQAETLDDVRTAIRASRRQSVTTRVAGVVPGVGTQFITSYQWANLDSLTPAHLFLTQRMREGVGLNIQVRQPIPYFGGLPGHLEATADLRNLLAQGYVPLTAGDRRMYLMHTPRSVRGGLSFIF